MTEPDLQIHMEREGDHYAVVYATPAGTRQEARQLTRAGMVQMHVTVLRELQPKTVVVLSGGGRTALHPGAVKAIIEGKLGPQELTLGE